MVITRHRALFAKPGQLKDMIKLPAKRTNSNKRASAAMTTVEALLEVPYDQIRDIVFILHESMTMATATPTDSAFK